MVNIKNKTILNKAKSTTILEAINTDTLTNKLMIGLTETNNIETAKAYQKGNSDLRIQIYLWEINRLFKMVSIIFA